MARHGGRSQRSALKRVGWALAAGVLAVVSAAGTSSAAWQTSVPGQPTGLSAAAAGNGEVALSWDDPSDSTITGYEFEFQAELAKLTASDAAAQDYFGRSVAIDGDTMVVGAPTSSFNAREGAVYVYVRDAGVWSHAARLTASDGHGGDGFGLSVAIDGATVVVGAYGDDDGGSGSGSAYVFSEPASGWVSATSDVKLTASDAAAGDMFGRSVAIDGTTVVVGAYGDDDGGGHAGSAYVFSEPASGWVSVASDVKLTASDAASGDRFGWSVAVDGATVVVGAYQDNDGGTDAGSAYVFSEPAGGWVSASSDVKLTASDPASGDRFGVSVAIDGGIVVVGAYEDDDGGTDAGSAYVFSEPASGWVSASSDVKLTASDPAAEDWFGWSVAIDGATVVVSAHEDDDVASGAGSAYVFSEPAGGWVSVSSDVKLTASDPAADDYFGVAVAIDGATVVVGASLDDDDGSGSGSAYVFHAAAWAAVPDSAPGGVNATSHTITHLSSASYEFRVRANNSVGASVPSASATATASLTVPAQPTGLSATAAGNGEVALSWADGSDSSIAGYEFDLRAEVAKLTASDAAGGDQFGHGVAVDGDTMVVGAPSEDSLRGAAYVFVRDAGVWGEAAKLTASDGAQDDWFGWSVAIDGDTVVVGAFEDDDGAFNAGSAYVFTKPVSGWATAASSVKLTASDPAAGDWFGKSLAIDGDTVVVGAENDDDGGTNSGSAYLFSEPAGGWASATSNVKLTASDAAGSDVFGRSVAIDDGTVVVGAGGDDDGAANSGSVYVFSEPAGGWASATSSVKLTASDPAADDWFGRSVAIDGTTIVVGADLDDDGGANSGSAYVFSEPADGWATATSSVKLTASDPASADRFGWSVAIDGDTVVVGAYGDDDGGSSSGSAYVFSEPAGGWASATSNVKLTASDPAADDSFGSSVAIHGTTVLAGAHFDDDDGSNSGSAYVFHATAWTAIPNSAPGETNATTHTITHLPSASYEFRVRAANSIGASAPTAAVTATASLTVPAQPTGLSATPANNGEVALSWDDGSDSSIAGYEYDFQVEIAKLTASDPAGNDQFGWSVAVDGDTMVVGAPSDDSRRGAAYVYVRESGVWSEAAKLTASDRGAYDRFGDSVAIDGDTVVVGADQDDDGGSDSGSAYVFSEPAGGWVNATSDVKLTASDPAANDRFGFSVAVDGGTVVVGAWGDDDGGTNSGSTYVFSEPASGWVSATSDVKLTASDPAAYDYFGMSVAVDGATVVVGAWGDDDGGTDSGSVYVFSEPASGWVSASSDVKLTASDPAAYDRFGRSVAIDGGTVVVGAWGDDDGVTDSGSAYVFSEPASGWVSATSSVKLTASDPAANDYFGWSVAIDDGTVVVGAHGDDDGGTNSGSAYVFSEPASGWVSASGDMKQTASDPAAYDVFGRSVAVDGATVVVGAHQDDDGGSESGSAYVFRAAAWTAVPDSAPGGVNATSHTVTHLSSAGYEFRVRAANSVGVSAPSAGATATASLTVPAQPTGLSAAAGGNGEVALGWDDAADSSIAGYEFDFQAEIAKLTALDAADDDHFGRSVAVDGDTMVVGAPTLSSNAREGAAFVYVRDAGVWNQEAKLTASDGHSGDLFGWSVAIDGATVVVGAYGDDDGGSGSGSAYVFSEPASGWASAAGSVKLTAADPAAVDAFGYSVAVDGATVVVGAYGDDDGGSASGSVYVFSEPAGGWVSATSSVKLTAADPAADDAFGWSVAVDGATVVVGAYLDDDGGTDSGSVYVFSEPASGWVSATSSVKLTAADPAADDLFGRSVAVDDGTVVVGADGDDDGGTDSGSAYVFSEPDSGWVSAASDVKLTAADPAADDWFGYSVAVDGAMVVVGADRDDDGGADSGSAYVFSEPASGWASATSDAKLTASDPAASDRFGYSVAVDDGTVVIGAYGDDDGGSDSGSAYVFHASLWKAVPDSAPGGANATSHTVTHLSSASYEFRVRAANSVGAGAASAGATATASLTVPGQPSGLSAAAAGNGEVALGWDDAADSSISGYEFDFQAEVAKLTASDAAGGDHFGYVVAVDGDTMVVGAPRDESSRGAAYVFVRAAGVWGEAAKLTASDGAQNDWFGWSVAIDGGTVVVGASGDDDGASNAGSVYVFSEPVSGWATVSSSVKLTASDPTQGDWFGKSVAIDGATVVVGAENDDDGGTDSGSVYVFGEPAGGWVSATSSVKLTASDAAAGDVFGRSVAIDDGTVVVGAGGDDDGGANSGSAYVFGEPAGGWVSATSSVKLTASDAAAGDVFGRSVAIDGGTVVVGADLDDDGGADSGSAYVFSKPAGGWVSAAGGVKLTASDPASNDWFGYAVAVDGATVVVSAHHDDDDGISSGSVHVFSEPASGWASASSDMKLIASDAAVYDEFGSSVAIDNGTVVAGALGNDDDGSDSGSAHVFHVAAWAAVPDSAPGGANATSHTITQLSSVSYEFRVRAANSVGVSDPSAAVTFTPTAPAA